MDTLNVVEGIFFAALQRDTPDARRAYLDEACGGDDKLRQCVDRLLKAQSHLSGFLEGPGPKPTPTGAWTPGETAGTVIGPYKLLQEIGEGGMGTVWMAEQEQPVRRMVALKVIKAGMDSAQVVARFEAERQALAVMDHPHIAKVFDGGTTEQGRPYFVMELVKGTPITTYCDEHRLSPKQRLELFVPVCQALQHAHQKGVIHRDIKPSNVLVAPYDGRPVPKVIDFGVAKATGQRLTERTMFTGFGAVVGTLEYMSPEQAELNNQDIDTRSDVYGLGVLLYELLTGAPPLTRQRLKQAAFTEALRIIREEEPPKPSTRLRESKDSLPSISAQRQTEPAKLTRLVRGELDWIVMKALEKDRTRRYDTANGLAMDLQRYLADEPVLAGPPRAGYRLRKFVRKHRRAFAALAVCTLLLVLGATVSTWQAVRATLAERHARDEKSRADVEALNARDRAEAEALARQEADRALTASRQALAVGRLQLVQAHWRENHVREANALLDEMPPDERVWGWDYLKRLVRGGHLTLYGHAGPVTNLTFSPDGQRLATTSWDRTAKIWDARTGREILTLRGHISTVSGVAFSPDGQRLATVGGDRTVRLWEARTGRELLTLRGHSAGVGSVAFSPDGQRLASGSGSGNDQTARVWNAQTGQELLALRWQTTRGGVTGIAFSPDGKRLATSGFDGTTHVWDTGNGQELLVLRGHDREVNGVAFCPDGRRLATGSFDGTARVWDARTGQELVKLVGHNTNVRSVTFSPDGGRVATAGHDETTRIWDARGGQELLTLRGPANRTAFSPDGQRLATAGDDWTVKVWDVRTDPLDLPQRDATGRITGVPGRRARVDQELLTFWGHDTLVVSVAFSPDGRRLATGGYDRAAKVWDARTGQELVTLRHPGVGLPALRVAFSPDGQRLATTPGPTAAVWDAQTGQELLTFLGHTGAVTSVAFSADGRRLATGSADRTVKVWDAQTARELVTLKGHSGAVTTVAFSPDGRRLATAGSDHIGKVWDAQTGHELLTLAGPVNDVAFSPDGRRLATVSDDRIVRIWDAQTGAELVALHGHTGIVRRVVFSPDGRHLASAGAGLGETAPGDPTTKIWDAQSGQEVLTLTGQVKDIAFSPDGRRLAASLFSAVKVWDTRPVRDFPTLRGHTDIVRRVTFSPDGRRVATASADRTVKLWDAQTARQLRTLTGHTGGVNSVTFSPDGQRLATASVDRTAKVWNAQTGQELLTLKGHARSVLSVAFDRDGRRLATGSEDGTARVWDAQTGQELLTIRVDSRNGAVTGVAFSPDGRGLSTTGGEPRVWDLQTGKAMDDPDALKFLAQLHPSALSPDGGRLARIDDSLVYLHELKEAPSDDDLAGRQAMAQPDAFWQHVQADRYEREGQWFAAAVHLDLSIAARPEVPLFVRRGRARAELGRWDEARTDFARATEEQSGDPIGWRGLALTHLALGHPDDYRRTCDRFLERFARPPQAVAVMLALGTAPHDPFSRTALIRSGRPLLQPLIALPLPAVRTATLRPETLTEPARLLPWVGNDSAVRGAVLVRAGRYDEAIQALANTKDAVGLLYRSLAEQGRGRVEAAQMALQEAERWLAAPTMKDAPETNADRLPWDQRFEVEVLRTEVREKLVPPV